MHIRALCMCAKSSTPLRCFFFFFFFRNLEKLRVIPVNSSCHQEFVYEYAKIILGVMTSSPEPHGKAELVKFLPLVLAEPWFTFSKCIDHLEDLELSGVELCWTTKRARFQLTYEMHN